MLAQGQSVRKIADLLYLSPKTVATHRGNILSKMDASNVVELSREAIRQGLLEV